VDPFDRFTRHPLEEVLVGEGSLTRARAEELLGSARTTGEPFALVLLESGAMTAWDLAKTVATHYQMPVHPLTGYRFDKSLVEGVEAGMFHRHHIVPLGLFGRTRTFAVVQPPNRELIDELTAAYGTSLFFFVAEGPDIARVLREQVKVVDVEKDAGWSKLFDEGEQSVSKTLIKK
jgi:hypothetical protein